VFTARTSLLLLGRPIPLFPEPIFSANRISRILVPNIQPVGDSFEFSILVSRFSLFATLLCLEPGIALETLVFFFGLLRNSFRRLSVCFILEGLSAALHLQVRNPLLVFHLCGPSALAESCVNELAGHKTPILRAWPVEHGCC